MSRANPNYVSQSVAYYKRLRLRLIHLMGGTCEKCPQHVGLEFHEVNRWERDKPLGEMTPVSRINLYYRLWKRGECQLLCPKHHAETDGFRNRKVEKCNP